VKFSTDDSVYDTTGDDTASTEPVVPGDDRLHLVEEEFLGHAAEEAERRLQARKEGPHILLLVEADPHVPRVAEHDEKRVSLAPGQAELGKDHLGLSGRRRLETHERLFGRPWSHLADVVTELRVAARIAGGPDLLQEPHRRERGIVLEPLADGLLVGIELLRHWRARLVARRLVQVAIQLARGDPAADRTAVDSKQLRNRGLAQPLIEIVSQYHASLQSDQVRLRREGEGAKCTISRESAYAAPHGLPATIPVPSGTLSSARSGKLSTA